MFDEHRAYEIVDFNVNALFACICKQCHSRRKKLDRLPQNLKIFTDFFKR